MNRDFVDMLSALSGEALEPMSCRMTFPLDQSGEGEDGVDRSLIRWMLSLSPRERLDVLDRHARDVAELRELNRGA